MTIYMLDDDPTECAKLLDDKSLDSMIKDIAQVLCNVHYLEIYKKTYPCSMNNCALEIFSILKNINVPLKPDINKMFGCKWSQWARECKANYLCLVDLGLSLYNECWYRYANVSLRRLNKCDDYRMIILWARDNNVPDLPDVCRCRTAPICMSHECEEYPTEFPLVMPKKYVVWCVEGEANEELSYRNYYKAKMDTFIKKNPGNLKYMWARRDIPDFLKD